MRQDAEARYGRDLGFRRRSANYAGGKILRTRGSMRSAAVVRVERRHAFRGPRPESRNLSSGSAERFHTTVCGTCSAGNYGLGRRLQYKYGNTLDDAREKLQYDLFYIKNASIVWTC